MELFFNVSPHEGEISVYAKYTRADVSMPHFYINRDAALESIICDERETNTEVKLVYHPMLQSDGYMVNKVTIPPFNKCFEIRYRLKLTGETGAWPYVKEKITPEFSLLRFETFCYPMFFEDWESFRKPGFKTWDAKITVPEGFTAIPAVSTEESSAFFNCAIAPYEHMSFSFGQVYFLPTIAKNKRQMVEKAMEFAFSYMNKHFGQRDSQKTTFAAIPSGFGSFALRDNRTIFVVESAFDTHEDLASVVHEFIHLDWNANPKDSIIRARFFDEAFTSYFENRVMNEFLKEISEQGYNYNRRKIQEVITAIKNGEYEIVPICKFGEMEYGDLSYSIGALCMEELYTLLGERLFDEATAAFLAEYKETPADFEDFCEFYKKFCGEEYKSKLTRFFEKWIYSSEGLECLINSYL